MAAKLCVSDCPTDATGTNFNHLINLIEIETGHLVGPMKIRFWLLHMN
jgi:hypothetical protein